MVNRKDIFKYAQRVSVVLKEISGLRYCFRPFPFLSMGVSGSKPTALEIVKASRVTCRIIFVDYVSCKCKVFFTSEAC
jgi:hypothetical protein